MHLDEKMVNFQNTLSILYFCWSQLVEGLVWLVRHVVAFCSDSFLSVCTPSLHVLCQKAAALSVMTFLDLNSLEAPSQTGSPGHSAWWMSNILYLDWTHRLTARCLPRLQGRVMIIVISSSTLQMTGNSFFLTLWLLSSYRWWKEAGRCWSWWWPQYLCVGLEERGEAGIYSWS